MNSLVEWPEIQEVLFNFAKIVKENNYNGFSWKIAYDTAKWKINNRSKPKEEKFSMDADVIVFKSEEEIE